MEGVTRILLSFDVFISNLFLTYFVPQRDLGMLYCIHRIELIIMRKVFIKVSWA